MNGGGLIQGTIKSVFPMIGAIDTFINFVDTNKTNNSVETYQNKPTDNNTSTENSSTENSSTEDTLTEDTLTENTLPEDEDLYNDIIDDTVEGGWDSMLDF